MNIEIYAVGDVMLGEQALCYNFGVKSTIKNKGVDYLFKDVRDILKTGDIVFGNLEAPISNKTNKNGFEANFFRAEPNVIGGLKNANFNVLSVANNHIMEHGDRAFLSTVSLLKENNITPVGVANKTEILEIDGFKIAIIGYSFIDDFISNHPYNKVSSDKGIREDIKNISDSVDLVILSLHWGYEYIHFPSPEQVEIGRRLIDCGVDIVLGGIPMSSKVMRFIYFFAKWIEGHSIEIYQPLAVFTTAEKLYANMLRERIETVFNCDVYDAYGLTDRGPGAYESSEHSGLHIDTERSIMEVVDIDGNQLEKGEEEILATSLYNYAMPFIRYDTGDLGYIIDDVCGCGRGHRLLKELGGRSVDVLITPEGKNVHGWFFLYIFWEYCKGVKEYQVIQEKLDKIVIKIVPEEDFDEGQLDKIREIIRERSEGWNIKFKFVDEIERTGAGKYKFIVNNMGEKQ